MGELSKALEDFRAVKQGGKRPAAEQAAPSGKPSLCRSTATLSSLTSSELSQSDRSEDTSRQGLLKKQFSSLFSGRRRSAAVTDEALPAESPRGGAPDPPGGSTPSRASTCDSGNPQTNIAEDYLNTETSENDQADLMARCNLYIAAIEKENVRYKSTCKRMLGQLPAARRKSKSLGRGWTVSSHKVDDSDDSRGVVACNSESASHAKLLRQEISELGNESGDGAADPLSQLPRRVRGDGVDTLKPSRPRNPIDDASVQMSQPEMKETFSLTVFLGAIKYFCCCCSRRKEQRIYNLIWEKSSTAG